MPLRGTALIVHSGGPTPVLNASLAGIVTECRKHPEISAIYGARHGNLGLTGGDFFDLTAAEVSGIARAPGSALGTSRRKIEPGEHKNILAALQRIDARFLFYTGGNGSMETALELDGFFRGSGYDLRVIGIPKTIDNDIAGTDHTPGYASCARFFAHAVRDIGEDNRALPPPVEVVEVLGRNTGWVVAATALARHYPDDPPHLIYLPERGISPDQLCADVERVYRRTGRCLVAVCEGQRDAEGGWFGAEIDSRTGSRSGLPSNMGSVFARIIAQRTGLRARAERPGLLGRSCSLLASEVDREEAWRCGEAGVRAAVDGGAGVMIAIERANGLAYSSRMATVPLGRVAGMERQFPTGWIARAGNDVTRDFLEWLRPLTGVLEPYCRL